MPIVKERLQNATPVMALILLSFVPLLVRILDNGTFLADSVILNIQISETHDYKLHVKAVALQ